MDILLLTLALMIGGDDPTPPPPPPPVPLVQQCGKQPNGIYIYCTDIVPQP